MDVENLEFHQDTVASDSNSPLHLIREKEIEISGRMLAAKRQADEIVADARKRSAAISWRTMKAHSWPRSKTRKFARKSSAITGVGEKASQDAAALEDAIGKRMSQAVSYVLDSVMGG